MNAEREQRMMIAAKILAGAPFNELPQDELDIMLNHGTIIGGFICGVHWADKNPESPWIHIESRMPEQSLPELSNWELRKKSIKAILLLKNGRTIEGYRRISTDGTWYWNIPIRMRDEITHWMPVPPRPQE